MSPKTKQFWLDVAAFGLSYIIQDRISRLLNLENLFIDLFSYMLIFVVVYALLSLIFRKRA